MAEQRLPERQVRSRRKRSDGGPSTAEERAIAEESKLHTWVVRETLKPYFRHLNLARNSEEALRVGRQVLMAIVFKEGDAERIVLHEGLLDPEYNAEYKDVVTRERVAEGEARIAESMRKARPVDEEGRRFTRAVEQQAVWDALEDARRRRDLEAVAQMLAAVAPVAVPVIAQALGLNPATLQLPVAPATGGPPNSSEAAPPEPPAASDAPAPAPPASPLSLPWGLSRRRRAAGQAPRSRMAVPPAESPATPPSGDDAPPLPGQEG